MCSPEDRNPPGDVAERLESLLGPDVEAVRSFLGAPIARAAPLSRTRPWDADRAAFLVETRAGQRVKLRRMPSEARARSVARLVDWLGDPRVPRVLFTSGRLLVDEWVEGRAVAEAGVARGCLADAGALLGSIHATAPPPGDAADEVAADPAAQEAALADDLAQLASVGRLDRDEAARLARTARGCRPSRAETGLVHGDFCADNLVIDASGQLRVVDNEALGVGPFDLDLARTEYRWPLGGSDLDVFLTGYAPYRDPAAARRHARFWRIRVLAKSARLRTTRGWRGADVPLGALRALAAGP